MLVFIYTCPSGSKIRERMLYSSSKANVILEAENEASIKVIKKVFTAALHISRWEKKKKLNNVIKF